jgi:predicted ribosome quality control (RQC) complex YloA/Tae2 family protein
LDSFVIKAIVDELRSWICPGFIKRVVQTDAYTLWLKVKGKRTDWLVISTKSPFTGLYSTSGKPAKTAYETPFSLALSKHIIGGEVIDISVEELERVVKFEIIPRKAGYKLQRQNLILELIDYNASLFLIETKNNRILACSRTSERKERRVLPGELYKPLPYPSKHNPFKMTASEWRDLFSKRPPEEELSVFLAHNLIGIRPLLAEEVVFRARLSDHDQANTVLLADKSWNCLQGVLTEYGSLAPHPIVIIYPDSNELPVLTSVPLRSKIDRGIEKVFSKMNEATAYFHNLIDQIRTFRRLKEDLKNLINREKKRHKKRLTCLEEDLDKLREAERSRYYGDLLMAHLQFVLKGMSEITLPDLFHEGKEVSIPLDPAKNAVQNAQSYFKRYTKAKRGLTIIKERKAKTEDLLRKIYEAETMLGTANDLNALREIEGLLSLVLPKREIIKLTYTPSGSITYSSKKGKTLTGMRFFKIAGTWDILVGKTDMANDRLTRELAKPEDIWFHVHDAPGSHVVLKNPGRLENIPYEIIKKAASVAAFFSRQRDEEKVLVGYTRKKHVRKPKGMKPGQVLVDRQKTVLVKPTLNDVIPIEN